MDPKPILVVGRIAEPSSAHTELYLYSLDRSRGVGRITVAEETSLNSGQQRIFGRVFLRKQSYYGITKSGFGTTLRLLS